MIERWIVAELRLDTALHIGAGKGNEPTDAPLRRTGDGRVVVPGRAIGGALRTTATRLAPRLQLLDQPELLVCKSLRKVDEGAQSTRTQAPCGCIVCQLFGELYPSEDEGEATGGAASRLWVSDAFTQNDDPQTHVRDGVGVMRDRGTAARNVKFDFETVPKETVFHVRLRLVEKDIPEAEALTQARACLLAATLAEWEAGRGRLGAGAARGLGAVTLREVRYLKTVLSSADDLIGYLKATSPWSVAEDDGAFWQAALTAARQSVTASPLGNAAGGFIAVKCTLEMDSPFLTNDPLVGLLSGFDHAPQLQVAVSGPGEPVISGGSLRGALRSRAEKIARTLWSLRWPSQEDFLAHCPACFPFARHPLEPLASCDARVETPTNEDTAEGDLCLACRLFGSPRQGSRLWVEDAHWAGPELTQDVWKAQDFLAIDRFTGGGQEGAKFDAAPLVNARFECCLTLHVPRAWELGWLVLVLRDLCDGHITVGFGAAKGFGSVRAKELRWEIGTLGAADFPGDPDILTSGKTMGIFSVTTRPDVEMAGAKQAWLAAFLQLGDAQPARQASSPPQADTFFSQVAEDLYGLPRSGR